MINVEARRLQDFIEPYLGSIMMPAASKSNNHGYIHG
jgi:hypothetical protein